MQRVSPATNTRNVLTAWSVRNSRVHIHSLSSEGREIVLAFEAGAEAQRFALVLKAQGFYEPTPRKMDVRDLEAFYSDK